MNRNTMDGWVGLDPTQTCFFLRSPDNDNQKWGQNIKQASSFKSGNSRLSKLALGKWGGRSAKSPCIRRFACTHLFSSTYIYVFAKRGGTTKGLYSSTKPGVYSEKRNTFHIGAFAMNQENLFPLLPWCINGCKCAWLYFNQLGEVVEWGPDRWYVSATRYVGDSFI